MSSTELRNKVKEQIDSITDDRLLNDVYLLLHGMQETGRTLKLNPEQRSKVSEALGQYGKGQTHTTESVFSDLLDDE